MSKARKFSDERHTQARTLARTPRSIGHVKHQHIDFSSTTSHSHFVGWREFAKNVFCYISTYFMYVAITPLICWGLACANVAIFHLFVGHWPRSRQTWRDYSFTRPPERSSYKTGLKIQCYSSSSSSCRGSAGRKCANCVAESLNCWLLYVFVWTV